MQSQIQEAQKIIQDYESLEIRINQQENEIGTLEDEKGAIKKPLLFGKDKYEQQINLLKDKITSEEKFLLHLQEDLSSLKNNYKSSCDTLKKQEEEELNRLNKVRDDELRMIYDETKDESSGTINLISFGDKILDFATKTNTDYCNVVNSICDKYYQGSNSIVFIIACIVQKFKNYDNQMYKVVEELHSLSEDKKIDFDEAANSLSKQYNIPVKEIMNIRFGVISKEVARNMKAGR